MDDGTFNGGGVTFFVVLHDSKNTDRNNITIFFMLTLFLVA